MNLHLRLGARYAAVLFAALLVLAGIALAVMDRVLRTGLDARLQTEGYAAAALIDARAGNVVIDADDRPQFLSLTSGVDQSIVTDRSGRVVLSTVAIAPPAIAALALRPFGFHDVGSGEDVARACVVPIVRAGIRSGSIVVWRASDWIDETERGMALAFFGAAVVIAALAWGVGAILTRGALDDAFTRQRRFTADASHELRAPLAVIRAEADLALRKDRAPAEYRASLASIAAEADRLEALTASLLSAARAQESKPRATEFDLVLLVRSAIERLQPLAQESGVAIVLEAAEASVCRADRDELERAAIALLHNAVKFSPRRGRVAVSVLRRQRWVEFTVSDEGPGFSQDALRHALEPFWSAKTDAAATGTGLGLTIVHGIVNRAGGTIALANTARGACVTVRLRAAR